jgi:hypothetical protein
MARVRSASSELRPESPASRELRNFSAAYGSISGMISYMRIYLNREKERERTVPMV